MQTTSITSSKKINYVGDIWIYPTEIKRAIMGKFTIYAQYIIDKIFFLNIPLYKLYYTAHSKKPFPVSQSKMEQS